MPKRADMIGRQFGRLTVLTFHDRAPRGKTGTLFRRWRCICECGVTIISATGDLTSGNTKSCGCWKTSVTKARMTTHGKTGMPEYVVWQGMLRRCETPTNKAYKDYGGRGIKVCDRWHDFEAFLADMGARPTSEDTIERKDNSGHYEPENCIWVTRGEQNKNQRQRTDNTSGVTGVVWNAARSKWEAFIGVKGARVYLGLFDTVPEAACVRQAAMKQNQFSPSHGAIR